MLKFVQKIKPEFILKSDDNCFVNLKALHSDLSRRSWKSKFILGSVLNSKAEPLPIDRPKVNVTSRHSVPFWMFKSERCIFPQFHQIRFLYFVSDKHFPPFVSGSGYVIPRSLMLCLYKKGLTTPYLTLEDIFITGIVGREQCGAKLVDDRHFKSFGIMNAIEIESKDILIHDANRKKMFEIIARLRLGNSIRPVKTL